MSTIRTKIDHVKDVNLIRLTTGDEVTYRAECRTCSYERESPDLKTVEIEATTHTVTAANGLPPSRAESERMSPSGKALIFSAHDWIEACEEEGADPSHYVNTREWGLRHFAQFFGVYNRLDIETWGNGAGFTVREFFQDYPQPTRIVKVTRPMTRTGALALSSGEKEAK